MKKILMIILATTMTIGLVGCVNGKTNKEVKENQISAESRTEAPAVEVKPEVKENKATIYVPDEQAQYLIPEITTIQGEVTPLELVKAILVESPNCFDKDAEVLDVEVNGNTAYVNMNAKFETPNTGSTAAATMKIYSIVNTLCIQSKMDINNVKFKMDGVEMKTISQFESELPFQLDTTLFDPSTEGITNK